MSCDSKRYSPELPIWSYDFYDKMDFTKDFLEWRCNYDFQEKELEPTNEDSGVDFDYGSEIEPDNSLDENIVTDTKKNEDEDEVPTVTSN